MINLVLPGVTEVLANLFRPVKALIRDDLPTLDLPINAYSGKLGLGHPAILAALITNEAVLIFTSIANYECANVQMD